MIYRGLVITGTGTGVGKTVAAAALAKLFRECGLKVGVLKPVETGCGGEELSPADGLLLARAAGVSLCGREEGAWIEARIEDVAPWRFAEPLAPVEAGRLAGIEISVDRIYMAMDRWMERADLVIVETAGGLLVPINTNFNFADLIQGFELPVIVAAPNRLGVINHMLLTLEALRSRGLVPIGVILNNLDSEPDLSAGSNARLIREHGGVPTWEVPRREAGEEEAGQVMAAALALREHLPAIRQAMESDWARVAARYAGGGPR